MKKTTYLAATLLTFACATVFAQTGNVGIGTTSPGSKLSVNGNTAIGSTFANSAAPANSAAIEGQLSVGTLAPVGLIEVVADNKGTGAGNDHYFKGYGTSTGPGLFLMSAQGTYASPTPLANNDIIGGLYFGPYANGFFTTSANVMGIYKGDGTSNQTAIAFNTSGNLERMRVNEDGNVTIGVVDPFVGFSENSRLSLQTPSGVGQWIRSSSSDLNGLLTLEKATAGTGLDQFIMFRAGGTYYGNISAGAGSGVTYNSTSDQRLKENIRDTKYGIEDLMKIQVSDYNYKANKTTNHTGYIAQQLYRVFPEAVTKGGADVSKPWMVDYSKMTPLLTKAIQDQQAEIEELKKENAALKGGMAGMSSELNGLKASVEKLLGNGGADKSVAK